MKPEGHEYIHYRLARTQAAIEEADFDRNWIKNGRLPVEMGRFYRRLFDQRHKSDYDDLATFDREDVKAWLSETKTFVAQILTWIQEHT